MLRFCFGASGAGKSTRIYEEIINRSMDDPGTDYLIIVPDQFTMQTQKDVVKLHPSHAIMNIDVLSFGRLSHRVFEETGHGSFSVLDDVGKTLVLRLVADMLGERLPVLGGNMHRPGYIDEVKSTISEFMMYDIGDEELLLLEEKSIRKGALYSKLKDLRLLYSEFLKYIEGKYITTEETLDVLTRALPKSALIRDSVIVFDGFTGFTPIQYRVIKELLALSKELIVSLTIDPRDNPYAESFGEQELFMLTKKTVRDLERLEFDVQRENGSTITDFSVFRQLRHQEMAKGSLQGDIFIKDETNARHRGNDALLYLERSLFRYKNAPFTGDNNSVFIYEATNLAEEVRQTMIGIKDLVRTKGYAYRDIALVCGSLEAYGEQIDRAAKRFDIPVYVDQNTSIMLNPFIEYITSALNIVISGYKYEDVFHYMRSGLTSFDMADTDLLENYVRSLGIRGKKAWEDKFLRRMPKRFKKYADPKKRSEKDLQDLEKLEGMREAINSHLSGLFKVKNATAKEIIEALRAVIDNNNSREKLEGYKQRFEAEGNLKKAREYDQIYNKVMALFDQIEGLIGDEKLEISEFKDIVTAGIGEISVGTIPQDVDRIIVGDIERTRLKEVKVLFFVGVNDGNIPSNVGGGGILSDIDRQFLIDLGTEVEFAPTPRQQMYIQRLYLYMNLTKPTDKLYLSYAELSGDGKSQSPAYLIPKLLSMYEGLTVTRPEDDSLEDQLASKKDGIYTLSTLLCDYARGQSSSENLRYISALSKAVSDEAGKDLLGRLTEEAFKHYESLPLSKAIAVALYGATLENSVSRLEQFASCAYAHFIRYGLRPMEREDYEFDASDLGNVFHKVLEKYTGQIIDKKIDWKTLSKEDSDKMLNDALTECVDAYGDSILRSSARNQFMIDRIRRILLRTVDTLKYQMTKGSFEPAYVEMSFEEAGSIDDINIALSEDEKHVITERMKLNGRIDRVDLYEDPEHVYVKVMDFKSSGHKFNVASLYYGLQLQLVMYMNVASAVQKKLSPGKEVVPAAILYYHVTDPVVDGKEGMITDDINKAVIDKLKMTGLVNKNMDIVKLLDKDISGTSDIIPVMIKKDGEFGARSQTATREEYQAISSFVGRKIKEFGKNILDGDISVNPYVRDNSDSCTYCSYRSICGYDERIKGYKKRNLDLTPEEALSIIVSEAGENANNVNN
ncbi:MAG: PD-(D/E)XK nuclease family protein [Butyrivibrio sp.]|uniref:PD-(D/E)XK nuclease family protein n=1 Tax=Butyrivibrio sp. TaxID=28121 RepID=UPI001B5CEBF0|nr:PD-(D/E)XK nuclease family protein [Butyrivibrio sp.]MBP3782162.1 PD-(D/E)XK nuclease family protein [Butyrivibrio sp.]